MIIYADRHTGIPCDNTKSERRRTFIHCYLVFSSSREYNIYPLVKATMPYLQIQTNIPAAKIPDDFLKNSTTVLADMLKKPESVSTSDSETCCSRSQLLVASITTPCVCRHILVLSL